jgi:ribosomal protein S18 acetylase RimI-like enzyme
MFELCLSSKRYLSAMFSSRIFRACERSIEPCGGRRTDGPWGLAAVDILISGLEKSDLKHLLPSQSRRAGIADFGGLPVGTAFITEKDGIGYLWGMYVQPAWRRRGVGSALLRYVTNRPTQIASIETQVHVASLQARAFYLKTGFRRKSSEVAPGQIEEFLVMRATPETE